MIFHLQYFLTRVSVVCLFHTKIAALTIKNLCVIRTDKMNVILLMAVMCTLAFVHGWQEVVHNTSSNFKPQRHNNHPCQKSYNNNACNDFVRKHILKDQFNKSSEREWERYLNRSRLCDRPLQSFIMEHDETDVLRICNGSGRRLRANLCVSDSPIMVYNLKVRTSNCKVERIASGREYVTVACDKIENRCCPVHFENNNQRPGKRAEVCKP